ncbi:MAG TPA: beta-1,6-N-acetylglucosaminyltransferase [Chitinophagaceae bacterium]|nr:beta-1,6-N-acetylglucosaminyltransferase [Chitinophagaceae bacterium]
MAHIIMAYKDPPQLERLVKRLSHPGFDFYIHVDTKFDMQPFRFLENIERVYFIQNRVKVRWAGFSFTKAVFNCIEEILTTGKQYDFISCMSGQDYPVVSTDTFYSFFERQRGKNFLAIEKYGSEWWKRAAIRIHQYHMTDFDFRGRYQVQRLINAVLPQRNFPMGYTLYGSERATWWTISTDCAAWLLQFMKEHPRIRRFAKFTWAPDEFLIPTLIMNSSFKDSVVPENYRYIDWSRGGANPKILTVQDFEALKQTDKLLARKFDIKIDTRILDMLDELTAS